VLPKLLRTDFNSSFAMLRLPLNSCRPRFTGSLRATGPAHREPITGLQGTWRREHDERALSSCRRPVDCHRTVEQRQ
jgi:hypothetical protein